MFDSYDLLFLEGKLCAGLYHPPNIEIFLTFPSFLRSLRHSATRKTNSISIEFIILEIQSHFTCGEANLY